MLSLGFTLCGFSSESTAKFKKWKVELLWYEGPKSQNARVYCESNEQAGEIAKVVMASKMKY